RRFDIHTQEGSAPNPRLSSPPSLWCRREHRRSRAVEAAIARACGLVCTRGAEPADEAHAEVPMFSVVGIDDESREQEADERGPVGQKPKKQRMRDGAQGFERVDRE